MMNANAKIRFEFEGNVAFVYIGQVNFASVVFLREHQTFEVWFMDDRHNYKCRQEIAATSIADIFGISTAEAAQICAALSGVQICQCGQHLASPAHICPPRYHILGDNGTCTCCRQCEAQCRTYPQ